MVDSQCCVSFGRAYMLSYSVMSDSVTPWTVAHQAPPAMEFSRQEYWSGVPFPSPGDLPDPGIEPTSPALAGAFFTTVPPGKPVSGVQKSDLKRIYIFFFRLFSHIDYYRILSIVLSVLYRRSLLVICFIYSSVAIPIATPNTSLLPTFPP